MSEKYETLSRLGLCHRCEKRKAMKNRKFCAECLEKFAQYNAEHYDRDKAKEYQKRRRELYLQKKAKWNLRQMHQTCNAWDLLL